MGYDANSVVSVAAESANQEADGKYSYPAGLMDFKLLCSTPCATATVTQYYFGDYDPAAFVMRKYNAATKTYQAIKRSRLSEVTFGGQAALKAVYGITDGSSLDDDGLADGVIVDPAGPSFVNPVATVVVNAASAMLVNTGSNLGGAVAGAAVLLLSAIVMHCRRDVTAMKL